MKEKLTIRVDRELALRAERHAQARGVSVSSLMESALREVVEESRPSFASRWRGKFKEARREDVRHKALARKYLDGGQRERSTKTTV